MRLLIALACMLPVVLTGTGCGKAEPGNPNIILISIDTLRADHLGCYGYGRNTSPNIDAFAKDAVLFENAFAPTCWTAPSHMSMFTGLYPSAHKVNAHPIPARLNDDIKTLTQYIKDAGYSTHGLYYGHYLAPELGFDRGYDTYAQQDFIANSVDDALALLDNAAEVREPFFLFLHVGDVHAPYMDINELTKKTDAYRDLYDPEYKGPIITGSEEEAGKLARRMWDAYDEGRLDAAQDIYRDIRHLEALYDGAINHTDKYLGLFFRALKERGIYDNSLIVFTSDHGEEFGEHYNFGHNQLYRELIQVPLIFKFPVSADRALSFRGDRKYQKAMLLDIMPTVLDMIGVPADRPHQGTSLMPLVNGKEYSEPVVYGESEMRSGPFQSHRSVLDKEYHFLLNEVMVGPSKKPRPRLLYDIKTDPAEKYDIGEGMPDKVEGYVRKLRAWQKDMASFRSKVTSDVGEHAPAEMSQEQKDWLKSLGYVQ